MENASKALIIAGAILLAILIISLGIMIYNQAAGVVNNNSMTEAEVNSFNQKFEQYIGENVRGANVNSLVSAVNTNNMSTDDESERVEITGSVITENTSDNNAATTYNKTAQTGKTYKVEIAGYTTGGLIQTINISEASASN